MVTPQMVKAELKNATKQNETVIAPKVRKMRNHRSLVSDQDVGKLNATVHSPCSPYMGLI